MPYLTGLLRIRSLRGVPFRPTTIGLTCERMDENMAAYLSGSRAAAGFCRWYMKWIYFPLFDHHIAVSEHAAAELRPASRGHKVQRGVWIRPMGADCAQFTPARRSAELRNELVKLAGAMSIPGYWCMPGGWRQKRICRCWWRPWRGLAPVIGC